MVDKRCSDYVLDQLEAERKFLLYAHHQEMLDAVEYAVRAKVNSFLYEFNSMLVIYFVVFEIYEVG